MHIKNYNIHNILKLQIRTCNKDIIKGLNNPLSYFEIKESIEKPDILLNIGKFTPSNKSCFLVDHKYYIKENYLYCEEYGYNAKWKVEIIGFETSPTIINFDMKVGIKYRYILQDVVPQDLILLPIIEFILGRKGFFLSHAGGIVKENAAVVLLGRPGSLKTTILMNSKINSKILGDDHLIIDLRFKKVYTFQLYPSIFEYINNKFKDEYLTHYQKLLVKTKLINDYIKKSEIWQQEPVSIDSFFIISRKNTQTSQIITNKIDVDVALKKLIANNKAEIYGSSIPQISKKRTFDEYILAYSFVFPHSSIATYWDDLKVELENMLQNVPIYTVEIPYCSSTNYSEELGKTMF